MIDYKIRVKTPMDIENIIDKAPLLGYHILNADGINREAEYIVVGNNQGVRWATERIFNDMHEDYKEISVGEFLEL